MKDSIKCLLITPLSEDFLPLRRLIAEALQESGIEPALLEEELNVASASPEPVVEKVSKAIGRADFIIADLTGGNPNVMYEVGLAHAMRKPVLFIIQRDQQHRIPFDLRHQLFYAYDPSAPDLVRDGIKKWVWLNQKAA
jgi:nucleoside 2-deoxyribosyltransferase